MIFGGKQGLFNFFPIKMEQIECSETSAYKIQTPGNHPEHIQQKFCFHLSLTAGIKTTMTRQCGPCAKHLY
jgi:hypothetical protein